MRFSQSVPYLPLYHTVRPYVRAAAAVVTRVVFESRSRHT